ncbi:TPA_asm: hypothetical protein [ssRNA phage Gerhypos.4_30]|uniref:Uncharacterized protein n=2 Tax=Fiersviridae TaxID=2842319 RepID=A0A8S5L1L3_9VIRU|nr:hypothetical protein QIL52_gp1 [ssRNA phage Gerhypos.4_30]QDH86633.1 MAG: hypothetical protein H4Bulk46582_000005 [Leviviridae sp.]DAD51371.1 TPA_asm: hypothetical protein [ssRNA phage Gerhypos.4_30]
MDWFVENFDAILAFVKVVVEAIILFCQQLTGA